MDGAVATLRMAARELQVASSADKPTYTRIVAQLRRVAEQLTRPNGGPARRLPNRSISPRFGATRCRRRRSSREPGNRSRFTCPIMSWSKARPPTCARWCAAWSSTHSPTDAMRSNCAWMVLHRRDKRASPSLSCARANFPIFCSGICGSSCAVAAAKSPRFRSRINRASALPCRSSVVGPPLVASADLRAGEIRGSFVKPRLLSCHQCNCSVYLYPVLSFGD